jgi:hypothetical protein
MPLHAVRPLIIITSLLFRFGEPTSMDVRQENVPESVLRLKRIEASGLFLLLFFRYR